MSSILENLYLERIVHSEQYVAATTIIDKFVNNKRQVLLLAQMQSGKTGIFLFVAFCMLRSKKVKNVILICGSNENELHEQLVNDANKMAAEFHTTTDNVKIYKSSDLKDSLIVGDDTLLVWDESHYAQGIQNRPFKFLQRSGLLVGGNADSDAKWAAKNSYLLSVSATPFAEFSDSLHADFIATTTRAIVRAEPGENYRGVEYYHSNRMIEESYSIKGNKADFVALLRSFKGQRKFALIRSRSLGLVRECAKEAGVLYNNYTASHKDMANLDALKTAPKQFTIVGLAGMCRMGKVVPKQHIGFVFEEAKTSKSDTLLQSLLGRLCGYYNTPELKACKPRIFLPADFTKPDTTTGLSEIERYIRNAHGEAIIPAKAAYIATNTNASDKFLLPKPIWISVGGSEDPAEDDPDYVQWKDMSRAERTSYVKEHMITYYTANPLDDRIQHAELMERLRSDIINPRGLTATSYVNAGTVERLLKTHQNGTRFDDNDWSGNHMTYFAYCVGEESNEYREEIHNGPAENGFFFVGYTEEANEETKAECEGRIVPTTGRECWNPKHTETTTSPYVILNTEGDLSKLKAGQQVLFIKKTILKNPLVADLVKMKLGGHGGKCWTKSMPGSKDDYQRIVVKITIEITIRITVEIIGCA